MAKTTGPLLSLEAHGSLGKLLTYSKKRTGSQVRKYNKPLVIASPKQRGQRRLTEFLVAQWQNLSAGDKATWETNAKASGRNLPGYQYFLREAQRDLYTHHGLCLYWHLNEYVNGEVKDLSGNGLDGTPGPSYPSNVPTLINAPFAKFGKAAQFDGVDEYFYTEHNAIFDFGTADFSIALRLFIDGDQNDKQIIGKYDFPEYIRGWHLRITTGPILAFQSADSEGASVIYSPTLTPNIHYEITLRRISTSHDLFVNAVSAGPAIETIRNITNPEKLIVGTDLAFGRAFKGIADEICVYNRGLSDAEITTRYKFALQKAS